MTDQATTWELFQDRYGMHDVELVDGKIHVTPEQAERLLIAAPLTESVTLPQITEINADEYMQITVIEVEEKS
jgi:hypothetical protein